MATSGSDSPSEFKLLGQRACVGLCAVVRVWGWQYLWVINNKYLSDGSNAFYWHLASNGKLTLPPNYLSLCSSIRCSLEVESNCHCPVVVLLGKWHRHLRVMRASSSFLQKGIFSSGSYREKKMQPVGKILANIQQIFTWHLLWTHC